MATVLSEIRQCEERIRQLQNAAEQLRFDLAVEQAVLTRLKTVSVESHSNGGGSVKMPGSIVSHIVDAFITSGKTMSVAEITEALEKAGVTTESPNGLKPSVASAISRRKDLFVKVGKGEYGLVERQKELHGNQKEKEQ